MSIYFSFFLIWASKSLLWQQPHTAYYRSSWILLDNCAHACVSAIWWTTALSAVFFSRATRLSPAAQDIWLFLQQFRCSSLLTYCFPSFLPPQLYHFSVISVSLPLPLSISVQSPRLNSPFVLSDQWLYTWEKHGSADGGQSRRRENRITSIMASPPYQICSRQLETSVCCCRFKGDTGNGSALPVSRWRSLLLPPSYVNCQVYVTHTLPEC